MSSGLNRHPVTIEGMVAAIVAVEEWNSRHDAPEREYVHVTNALMLELCRAILDIGDRLAILEAEYKRPEAGR